MKYEMEKLLPHAGNMIFIDEVESYTQNSIVTNAKIKKDNPFLVNNLLPSYTFIEIMAQSIAALSGVMSINLNEKVKLGFLLGCRKYYMYKKYIKVGTSIQAKVNGSLQDESGFGVYDCALYVKDEIIAKGSLSVYSPEEDFLRRI